MALESHLFSFPARVAIKIICKKTTATTFNGGTRFCSNFILIKRRPAQFSVTRTLIKGLLKWKNFQLNIGFERSSNPPISEPSVHHQPRGDFQFSMWLRNPLTSYKLYCLTPFFRMWLTLPISFSLFWSLLRVESSSTRYKNAWNNVAIWTKILKSRPVSDHWEDEIEWERSKASFFPGF